MLVLCGGLLAACTLAWAEGGSRPATPGEREFSLRVLKGFAQALPRPFGGFETRSAKAQVPVDRVAPGLTTAPLTEEYTEDWVDLAEQDRERSRRDRTEKEPAGWMPTPQESEQARTLRAEERELSEAIDRAMHRNDQAEARRLRKQMNALARRRRALEAEPAAILAERSAVLEQKNRLMIALHANRFEWARPMRCIREQPPISDLRVFAFHDDEGRSRDSLTVLVGPWERSVRNGTLSCRVLPWRALPNTALQAITVTVAGDPGIARRFLEGVDWQALKAMIR
jgi:hypothetical protein